MWKISLLAVHVLRFPLLVSAYCDIMPYIMESQNKNTPKFRPNPGLKLMDQVREVLRYYHYAYRTEQTYGHWILRYIHYFGGKTHPNRLGATDVERFLSHLATESKVSASTQRQALNALVFLYRDVLHKPLESEIAPVRSKRQQRPPTVLTQAEVPRLLAAMTGRHALMARLLYGSGLRLLECVRLRVPPDSRAPRQRPKGSRHHATTGACRASKAPIAEGRGPGTSRTSLKAVAKFICPLRSIGNMCRRAGSGAGSMLFLPAGARLTHAAARNVGITSMRRHFKRP
jgi:integrase